MLVGHSPLSADEVRRLRALESGGATVVAWQHKKIVQDRFPGPDVRDGLARAGIRATDVATLLGKPGEPGPEVDFEIEDAVIAWFKRYGRDVFRSRFRYGPMVLWWWAELYLYHETPLRLAVRDIEVLARLVETIRPRRLVLVRPVRDLEAAARRLASNVEVVGERVKGPPHPRRTSLLHASDLLKMIGTGFKSFFRARPAADSGTPRVFFLTHGSMWRGNREMYFDRIIPAVDELATTSVVAFGPPRPFNTRDLLSDAQDVLELGEGELPYRPIRRYFTVAMSLGLVAAFGACRQMWRTFERECRTDKEAAPTHLGVPLGSEAMASFRDMFYRQLPWAIRAYREIESALVAERPDVVVLYAESSGLGRVAVAAARELDIPTFAIQHGIMYPHYYSHEHAEFEMSPESDREAVPTPTRTAVYGSAARDLLVTRGSYAPDRIIITGSPKFDALVQAAEGYDRRTSRSALAIPRGHRFVVLATRWSAVGPVFDELVHAIEGLEDTWLLVKPHQAESTAPYAARLEELRPTRTRMLPGSMNLLEILFASDGLVTVDSFASSEALVLGRPVLVVNLPSNLGALVDKGVALGVRGGEPIGPALRELLFDDEVAKALERRRRDYLQEFAFGADGRSTERIVAAILETARGEVG